MCYNHGMKTSPDLPTESPEKMLRERFAAHYRQTWEPNSYCPGEDLTAAAMDIGRYEQSGDRGVLGTHVLAIIEQRRVALGGIEKALATFEPVPGRVPFGEDEYAAHTGIARGLHVLAWASNAEEENDARQRRGLPPLHSFAGRDVEEMAPRTSSAALHAAAKVIGRLEALNGGKMFRELIADVLAKSPGATAFDFGMNVALSFVGAGHEPWASKFPDCQVTVPSGEYYLEGPDEAAVSSLDDALKQVDRISDTPSVR